MKASELTDTTAQENQDGLHVPAHFVPTPRTVSPQAQAFLSHVSPVELMALPSSRDDKSGWRAYAEARMARLKSGRGCPGSTTGTLPTEIGATFGPLAIALENR